MRGKKIYAHTLLRCKNLVNITLSNANITWTGRVNSWRTLTEYKFLETEFQIQFVCLCVLHPQAGPSRKFATNL